MLPRAALLAAAAMLAAALAACGDGDDTAGDDRPLVITTVSPITNIVANVACGRAQVVGLVPEGVNSHTFEPRPSDAGELADADLVIVNGLSLEIPTIRLAAANVGAGVEIVELGAGTIGPEDYIFDFSFPESQGDPNPHLWTNPAYAARYAELAAAELARIDPEGAADYRANAAALAARFEALGDAMRAATATVPPERRLLLTYHDSFPYFARDYGWRVIGAVQPSDFTEPSPREVGDLIDQIEAAGVPAIFGSEVFDSPVLETIANETGARYVDDLRDDDLPGEPGDPEHSLLGLLAFDYTTIVTALGGDASALAGVDTSNICDEAEYAL